MMLLVCEYLESSFLIIGGYLRVCCLGDEELQVRRDQLVMRATGDVVEVTNRGLLFLGRQDDQVKRHGKRISLFHVKQVNIYVLFFI